MGDELDEILVKPTISEKKIVTLSKLSAITCKKKMTIFYKAAFGMSFGFDTLSSKKTIASVTRDL